MMTQLTPEQRDKLLIELDEKMIRAHDLVGKYIFYKDEDNTYKGRIISTTAYEEDADVYIIIKLLNRNKSAFSIPIDVAIKLLDKGYYGDKIAYIEVN